MADLKLYQPQTASELPAIKATVQDLQDSIVYIPERAKDVDGLFPTWFVHTDGKPVKFANGKYGYFIYGQSLGINQKPEPEELDYRISMRRAGIPMYKVEFGHFERIELVCTIFTDRDKLFLQYPERYWGALIAAADKSLPMYVKYISHSIFKGKNKKSNALDEYISTYIEPTDGNTNGYKFYRSEGYGEINLSKVISKKKVTEHALSKLLKKINDELLKDSKKIEADHSQAWFKDKKWVKDNLSDNSKKMLAVLDECNKIIKIVLTKGFDKKYKVNQSQFEGTGKIPRADELVLMLSKDSYEDLLTDLNFLTQEKDIGKIFDPRGVEVILCDFMDDHTAYLIERNMIQMHYIYEFIGHNNIPYPNEATRDIIVDFAHILDMVDIYHNVYIKHK